jgi:tetratricopeptide (TPR) repeat protein
MVRIVQAMKKPIIPRIWKLRIVAAILAPTLFILIVEGILRLSGYGDPTSFFIPVDGRDKVTGNSRYTYQYFPKQLVREPDLIRMDKKKPDDFYRIFVMGGSAARGTPNPRFGFGRILQVMLEEAYPDRRFEVINTGMVAINSHVVMRIARESADYDPDLFVVYMGNNEAVGPFGVGTEFNEQAPGRRMVALSMAAKSSRTGQLIRNLIGGFGEKSTQQAEWLGMETFNKHRVASHDPRLRQVYSHLEANLKDIAETARDADIPLILCTVPVNLRNCAPLASDHSADLDDAQREKWEKHYGEGAALEAESRWQEADKKYAQAETIDDQFAELHFRRARCALAQGDTRSAETYYKTARDLDLLRFRADSEINRIIRKAGDADPVILLDSEERFKKLPQVKHGIPGDELFYEHVHLKFEGNFELARMVFQATVKSMDDAPDHTPPSIERCAELLGLSKRDRLQMASSIMSLVIKPPFLDQLDYYQRCEKMHAQIRSLRKYKTKQGMLETDQALATALESRPNDLHNRLALAKLQLQQKKDIEAEKTILKLMQDLPDRADFYSLLGQVMLSQDRKTEAKEAFDKSMALAAQPLDYMILTAELYEDAGDKDRALELFNQALEAQPGAANRHSRLGKIFLQRGDKEQALKELELADSLLPGNGTILFDLSRVHFELGDIKTAVEKLRATLKANPFHLGARKQLGLILKKQGHFEEAAEQLSMVIPQEPEQVELRLHRAEARISLGKFDKAESDYRSVLKIAPDELNAALGLAWVLAVQPDTTPEQRAESIKLAERVVKATRRNSAKPLDVLAAAMAANGQFDKAEICADEAWGLALLGKDKKFAKAVSDRLRLYQKNKPYHLPERSDK